MCRYAYVIEQSVKLPNNSRDLRCEVACVHVGHRDRFSNESSVLPVSGF